MTLESGPKTKLAEYLRGEAHRQIMDQSLMACEP